MSKSKRIRLENDLLADLNRIADFVIGNELPEEAGIVKRNTLPEILSHAVYAPSIRSNLVDALNKVNILEARVLELKNKIKVKIKKLDLRRKA